MRSSWRGRTAFGYLLKDRVLDVGDFLEAADRVAAGGSALDPEVVKQLLAPPREGDALELTPRERECSGSSRGRTNAGIAKELWLTEKTVETHVRSILGKLDLPQDGDTHRRVLAVVTYAHRRVGRSRYQHREISGAGVDVARASSS